jgi:hypothetical protein
MHCMSPFLARNCLDGGLSARQLLGEDPPRQPFTGAAVRDPTDIGLATLL